MLKVDPRFEVAHCVDVNVDAAPCRADSKASILRRHRSREEARIVHAPRVSNSHGRTHDRFVRVVRENSTLQPREPFIDDDAKLPLMRQPRLEARDEQ